MSHSEYNKLREKMVERQLISRGIEDKAVLGAMRTVPRHLFVDESLRDFGYEDGPLEIGSGQTISQPFVVASMTEELGLNSISRVLEIGTGCGYQTAVLAEIADQVYSVEIIEDLHKKAKTVLDKLCYRNVHLRRSDGWIGWLEAAPFDAIIITAAAPKIPEALIEQLGVGGRMVLPLQIDHRTIQELVKLTCTSQGLKRESLYSVRFVPMTGHP